jgi:hypothetical protein
MFSQRARAYILAYHKIRQEQLTDSSTASDLDDITASPVKVEKLLKEFKTHRSAMDFDSTSARLYSLITTMTAQRNHAHREDGHGSCFMMRKNNTGVRIWYLR